MDVVPLRGKAKRKRRDSNSSSSNDNNSNAGSRAAKCAKSGVIKGYAPSFDFGRPALPGGALGEDDSLVLQATDITYRNARGNSSSTVIIHGCTKGGHSVQVDVTGFFPYLWLDLDCRDEAQVRDYVNELVQKRLGIPEDAQYKLELGEIERDYEHACRDAKMSKKPSDVKFKLKQAKEAREAAIQRLNRRIRKPHWLYRKDGQYVRSVAGHARTSVYGGLQAPKTYYRIETWVPQLIPVMRTALHESIVGLDGDPITQPPNVYEAKLPFILRYMIDRDFGGHQWIRVCNPGVVDIDAGRSGSQIRLSAHADDVHSIPLDERPDLAPTRILSFDIECIGSEGFPKAELAADKIISICNYVWLEGTKDGTPVCATQFSIGSCSKIDKAPGGNAEFRLDQYVFEDEASMLRGWVEFVTEVDPDCFTGYNICNFDFVYIIDRAKTLGISVDGLSRDRHSNVKYRRSVFTSAQAGTKISHEISIFGRSCFDMLDYIKKEKSRELHSKSLNNVAHVFLGMRKEEMDYNEIPVLQAGSPDDRMRLNYYCLKDAWLPGKLFFKLSAGINYAEMARISGVPRAYLTTRGEQIKTMSRLVHAANAAGFIVPYVPKPPGSFTGAVVLPPESGYYRDPIAILDFASLYPSIMREKNLCYTTIVPRRHAESRPDWDEGTHYWVPDIGDSPPDFCFLQHCVKPGLLPQILRGFLDARGVAKKDMAKFDKGTFEHGIQNGRQLSLKVSANSVYGFLNGNMVWDRRIAASVTARGRWMIQQTKNRVERTFTVANGYPDNAKVIYGDTDSVFVRFVKDFAKKPDVTLDSLAEIAKQAAACMVDDAVAGKLIEPPNNYAIFAHPHDLELEAFYMPLLLIKKKRYASGNWMFNVKTGKWENKGVKVMGIESKRKDNCELARETQKHVLSQIMEKGDIQAAIKYCHGVLRDLWTNKVPWHKLIITKGFTKQLHKYTGKQAHIELVKRMQRRNPDTAPRVGDRIQYIIVKGNAKHSKVNELAEDPYYAVQRNLMPDPAYYMHKQLCKPLMRVMAPVLEKDFNSVRHIFDDEARQRASTVQKKQKLEHLRTYKLLFTGDHMRKRVHVSVNSTAVANAMGNRYISNMFKRATPALRRCVSCAAILPVAEGSITCGNCDDETAREDLAASHATACAEKTALWDECVKCQEGNEGSAKACRNKTCPNLYARIDIEREIEDLGRKLGRVSSND